MPIRIVAALAALFFSTSAFAFDVKPYDAGNFKAAQAAGKPTLIHIHAPWCPTCRAQDETLQKIKNEPAVKDVTVYRVDFDSQKDAVRAFRATSQSTLIAFKGDKETGRAVGATSASAIEKLITTTTN